MKTLFSGDWELKKLKDIFDIETGTTPSTDQPAYWVGGEINWVTPADMSNLDSNIKITESDRKITEKALKDTNLSLMPKGSIIISTRAPVGYIGLVEKETTFNQGCKGLVPKDKNKTDALFYCYYLLSKRNDLENASGGSTFKELSKYSLENFEVVDPPFLEQKKIAEIISAVDEKLDLEKKRRECLERIKKGLMDVMLSGKKRVKVA
jgi:type I restriction enzyme S subunit